MRKIPLKNFHFCLIFGISAIAFVYIFYRAATLSLVHDEAYTFTNYAKYASIQDIVFYKNPIANNHLLNSLLINFIIKLPYGEHEIFIRLPNVLSFMVYSFSIFGILKTLFKDRFLQVLLFSLFILNPYLLDFFSLARGYGLGLGFMSLSIFLVLEAYRKNSGSLKIYLISLLVGALSLHSNLTFLNYYLGLVGITTIIFAIEALPLKNLRIRVNIIKLVKNLIAILGCSFIFFLPSLPAIIRLRSNDGLYYGGQSFLNGTISSLIESSLYTESPNSTVVSLIKYFVLSTLIILPILVVSFIYAKKISINKAKTIFLISSFFYIAALSTVGQHILLGNKYLIYRTAIFFIVLFYFIIASWIYFFSNFEKNKTIRLFVYFCVAALTIFSMINTANSVNLLYTRDWKYDADTQEMINDVINIKDKENLESITLIPNWIFLPSISYYLDSRKISNQFNVSHLEVTSLEGRSNYFLYLTPRYAKENAATIPDLSLLDSYKVIKEYKQTGNLLIRVN